MAPAIVTCGRSSHFGLRWRFYTAIFIPSINSLPDSEILPTASMLTTTAGLISLLIWIYLLLARGGFWRVSYVNPPESGPAKLQGLIAVIVPARNEAEVLDRSLHSLLEQTCRDSLHIFVVNDSSTDSTAEIARKAAGSASKTNVIVLEGQSLPPGWSGKVWAMNRVSSVRLN